MILSNWLSDTLKKLHRTRRSRTLRRAARHGVREFGSDVSLRQMEVLEDRALLANFTPGDVSTLIANINAANANGEADVIDLGGATFSFTSALPSNATNGHQNGLPVLLADGGNSLTIQNGTLERAAGASGNIRILQISGGTHNLDNVTLRDGVANGPGISIANASLNISNSTISGNQSDQRGGAIYSSNSIVRITDSVLSGNSAPVYGAAIYANFNSTTIVERTTISNNTMSGGLGHGAAIYQWSGGALRVNNSTISGNTGNGNGGAIYAHSLTTTIRNSTITGNSGSALYQTSGGSFDVYNSILTNNGGNDFQGTFGGSNNLTDQTGFPGRIGAVTGFNTGLTDNGGPTLTHAIIAGSNAIDAGSNLQALDAAGAPLTVDQRGYEDRTVNSTTDIGAFEFGATPPVTNNDPMISVADLNYTEGDNNGNPVVIDSAATASDSDGDADWDGGKLEVEITANSEVADEISITDNVIGAINTNGMNLQNGATVIGTLSAAEGTVSGGSKLTVTFNSNATNVLVQQVVRAISYRTTSDTPGTTSRTATFTLTDANSASASDTSTISVADAVETVNLSLSQATGTEAAETTITVTATASGNVTGNQTVTVDVNIAGAITAGDFDVVTQTITILDGETTGTADFVILDDDLVEGTETATIQISNPSAGIVLGTTVSDTVDITDGDTATIAFTNGTSSVAEDDPAHALSVTLSTAAGVTLAVPVVVDITDDMSGSGDNGGVDYTQTTTQVTFGATSGNGDTQAVTITQASDNLVEGSEDVDLSLSVNSGPATTGTQATHEVTITDSDTASVEFALASSSADEDGGAHDVVVNLLIAAGVTLQDAATFSVAAVDIDTDGTDYTLNNASVTFGSGSGNGATENATITPDDDSNLEGNEDVRLDLAYTSGEASLGAQDEHTVTINDNDNAAVTIEDVTVTEGNGLLFTVSLDNAVAEAFDVGVSFADGSATGGSDYDNTAVTLNFAGNAGESHQFTVTTTDESLVESSEVFTVNLSSTNAAVTDSDSATGTITNDDQAVVTVVGEVKDEGTGGGTTAFTFSVNLSNPVDAIVSMMANTQDGTATAADDYTAVTGALVSFNTGDTTTQTIDVDVNADSDIEMNEAFDLLMSGLAADGLNVIFDGGGASLTAQADVRNDDLLPGGPPPIIDDSSSAGYSTQGIWASVNRNGHDGGFRYAAAGSGQSVSIWSFDVSPGRYNIAATWRDWTNRATDAPYTILDGNTALMTVDVDQQAPAAGITDAGTDFLSLGEFDISSGRITVRLSNNANGLVVADAIRVEQVGAVVPGPEIQVTSGGLPVDDNVGVVEFGEAGLGATVTRVINIENLGDAPLNITSPISVPAGFTLVSPPAATIAPGGSTTMEIAMDTIALGTPGGEVSFSVNDSDEDPFNFTVQGSVVAGVRIIDNADTGFTPFVSGTTVNRNGHRGGFQYANSGTGDTARWTFNITPGTYVVAAAWRAHTNRATDATYVMLDGPSNTQVGSTSVDQTVQPTADFVEGPTSFDNFQTIGTVTISGNELIVELSDLANGLVVADAIRIERLLP